MKPARIVIAFALFIGGQVSVAEPVFFEAGHSSLQHWVLPEPRVPENNHITAERIELGKKLFFDPRLSGDGNMSCATCHNPLFGWSDGLPVARGKNSMVLNRASPTIVNTSYNSLQMWDGRKQSLEDQALGPMLSPVEMHMDLESAVGLLQANPTYALDFEKAYPGEGVSTETLAKALATFERTIVSRNSRFDQWIAGNANAMTAQEIEGFKLFVNPGKGNCEVCHSAPNFVDNGFHNVGLASYGKAEPDLGRYAIKPIGVLKGAFKTPTLRDIEFTAPYFHDGSAATLEDVMDHYIRGGTTDTDRSPNIKKLNLNNDEKAAIISFMKALSSAQEPFTLPILPQ